MFFVQLCVDLLLKLKFYFCLVVNCKYIYYYILFIGIEFAVSIIGICNRLYAQLIHKICALLQLSFPIQFEWNVREFLRMLASYLRRAATPIDTAAPRPSPTYLSILLVCINDLQARNCKFMLRKVEKDNKNNLWNIYSGFLRWAGVWFFWHSGGYVETTRESYHYCHHGHLDICILNWKNVLQYLCVWINSEFATPRSLGISWVFFYEFPLMFNSIWCCKLLLLIIYWYNNLWYF